MRRKRMIVSSNYTGSCRVVSGFVRRYFSASKTKPARVPMAAGVQTGVSNSVIVRSGQMTVSEPRRDWCLVFDDDVLGRGGESEWQVRVA